MAATVGIAALLATTACGNGGDGEGGLPPPASPGNGETAAAASATLDPKDAEAWEEIQATFDGFMETWIKWAAEGSPAGFDDPAVAELHEYADAFLWDEASAALVQDRRDGRLRDGRPDWRDMRLVEMEWEHAVQEREVPQAIFEVCVDESGWWTVDAETGDPVSAGPSAQVWTVTASWVEDREFGPDGWALVQREVSSQPC